MMMVLAMAGMFIGCAKPPEKERSAAMAARTAAFSAEARRFASADYQVALSFLETAEAQMQEKKYKEAKQGYIEAKAAFEKATGAVAAGKKAVVGEVKADELNTAIARLEEDWKNLLVLAKKVEAKLEKKKLWETDAKTFTERLKEAKDMLATDPVSAKLKLDSLKPFITSYTELFKQLEKAPEKRQKTK
jgi:hypothetical protein